ncbi:MAG TPA: thiamine pyrophosphate-dependent dehydrogenase E1 component subunit alpha [Sedimentisphaerales bacterium]|nr:thiamine pyrophosphate-dependent dehydrogenase E1 component subunit alpha [Sedimentisphaerales bacterium]
MDRVEIVKQMIRIRMVEQYIAARYPEQKMRCPTHLCLGQEAVPAVYGHFADEADIFVGTCRSHGYYLAKGGDLTALFAELLGKPGGCSGGFGGSMHIIDLKKNFWGSSAIVAGGIPIAAGAAFSLKYKKKPGVVVAFFGDAAMEEGVVYETVNFALLHNLPIMFVCENNGLAITTPIELRQCRTTLYNRFQAMGLAGLRVEENDIAKLIDVARKSYDSTRSGLGPTFVECRVSRWCAHVGSQFDGPVDSWWKEPVRSAARSCPICVLMDELIEEGKIDFQLMRDLKDRISEEIDSAYRQAERASDRARPNLTEFVYASGLTSELPLGKRPIKSISFEHTEQPKLVNAF